MKQPFADLELIRRRAADDATNGAITEAYQADRARVVEVLNELLATSVAVQLQCKHFSFMARAAAEDPIADCFGGRVQAADRFGDVVAKRISELRGTPDYRIEAIRERSHVRFESAEDVPTALREALKAVRIQIETLCAVVRWLGNDDPSTRRILEDGLRVSEDFAHRLAALWQARPLAPADESAHEQAVDTRDEAASERVAVQRDQWLEVPEKPPWWDPQWIARG